MLSAIPPTTRVALGAATNPVIVDSDGEDFCDADSGSSQPSAAPGVVAKVLTDCASIISAVTDGKSVTSANKKKIIELAKSIMDSVRSISSSSSATAPTAPIAASVPPQLGSNIVQDITNSVRAEIREEMTNFKNQISSQLRLSYSQATRGNPAPPPTRATAGPGSSTPTTTHNKPAIIITPRCEVKSKQDSIEAFKKSISFRASSYAPARVQAVSNGKLRVEFDSVEHREDTLKRLSGSDKVSAEPARSLRPMVILKGISRDVPSEDIVGILREQNRELKDVIREEEDLRLRFKRDNRNPTLYNAVFLAHPRVYRSMMDMVRVSLDHQRVHVDDFSPFVQCHKCLQFGHLRSKCDSAVQQCAHCGQSGHNIDHCPLKEKPYTVKCLNCSTHNEKFKSRFDIRHRANTEHCPRLRNMREKIVSRVDYGV